MNCTENFIYLFIIFLYFFFIIKYLAHSIFFVKTIINIVAPRCIREVKNISNLNAKLITAIISFIYHNMREKSHEFKGVCQFVFSGGRAESEDIIPRILFFGEKLWDVDLQYNIDNR